MGFSHREPQGGLCVCLAFERRLSSQPLALPAGSRPQRGRFLHLAHPPASWVSSGRNLCAYLGLARLSLLESRLAEGSDHFCHLALWEMAFVRPVFPPESSAHWAPGQWEGGRGCAPRALPACVSPARPMPPHSQGLGAEKFPLVSPSPS